MIKRNFINYRKTSWLYQATLTNLTTNFTMSNYTVLGIFRVFTKDEGLTYIEYLLPDNNRLNLILNSENIVIAYACTSKEKPEDVLNKLSGNSIFPKKMILLPNEV